MEIVYEKKIKSINTLQFKLTNVGKIYSIKLNIWHFGKKIKYFIFLLPFLQLPKTVIQMLEVFFPSHN